MDRIFIGKDAWHLRADDKTYNPLITSQWIIHRLVDKTRDVALVYHKTDRETVAHTVAVQDVWLELSDRKAYHNPNNFGNRVLQDGRELKVSHLTPKSLRKYLGRRLRRHLVDANGDFRLKEGELVCTDGTFYCAEDGWIRVLDASYTCIVHARARKVTLWSRFETCAPGKLVAFYDRYTIRGKAGYFTRHTKRREFKGRALDGPVPVRRQALNPKGHHALSKLDEPEAGNIDG